MADQATPEALRRAAQHIASATVRRMPADERAAYLLLAEEALGVESNAGQAMARLARECAQQWWWTSDLHYLAEAAQLRLLIEETMATDTRMDKTEALGRRVTTWWREVQQHG